MFYINLLLSFTPLFWSIKSIRILFACGTQMQYNIKNIQAWHVFVGFLACRFITSLSGHTDQQLDMFFLGFSHVALSHHYQRTRTSHLTCFSWVSRMSLYHITIRAHGPAAWHVFLGFLACRFLRYIRRLSVV